MCLFLYILFVHGTLKFLVHMKCREVVVLCVLLLFLCCFYRWWCGSTFERRDGGVHRGRAGIGSGAFLTSCSVFSLCLRIKAAVV